MGGISILLAQPAIWPPVIVALVNKYSDNPNQGEKSVSPKKLNISGGKLADNRLTTTNNLDLVNCFNLHKLTRLSTLTNQKLNQKLKSAGFSKYQVSIENGSTESSGTLVLKFVSNDLTDFQLPPTTIITGFETYVHNKLSLQKIDLDYQQWFNHSFPIITKSSTNLTNLDQISVKLLPNLIKSGQLYFDGITTSYPVKEVYKALPDLTVQLKETNNQYKVSFNSLILSPKDYQNGNWVKTTKTITLQQDSSKQSIINPPTWKEFLNHIIGEIRVKSTTSQPNLNLNNYYPSLFLGRHQYSRKNDYDLTYLTGYLNWYELQKKYKDSYLTNKKLKLSVGLQPSDLVANDYDGTLKFNLYLQDADSSSSDIKVDREMIVAKMKKITNFISLFKKQVNRFPIPSNAALAVYQQIMTQLKADPKKTVEKLFANTQKLAQREISFAHHHLKPSSINHYWYSADEQEGKWIATNQIIKKWFTNLFLFNKELKIDLADNSDGCGLQHYDDVSKRNSIYLCDDKENDAFYLQTIKFDFPSQVKLTLTKVSEKEIKITYPITTKVSFIADNQGKEESFSTLFDLTFSQSQFDDFNLKKTPPRS